MKRTFLFLLICLLVNSSYSQTYNFEFSISDFSIVENNGKHMIGYPTSFDVTNNTCEPILPSCVKNILLPPNKRVSNYSVTYTATNWQTNIDLEAMPMMHPTDGGDYADVPCSYDLKVYPDSIVKYGGITTIDHYDYISFVITPFVYDATIGLLSFINQVNITLELVNDTENYNIPTQNQVIKRIVHNPNDVDLYYQQSRNQTSATQNIDYLIITADSLKNSFEPLRIWKTQKGVYTKIITLSEIYSNYNGATPQLKIKRCVQDYYDNYGLKWLLLGGDDITVPILKAYSQVSGDEEFIPADMFYGSFDGAYDWNANGNDTIGESRDNIGINQVVNISRLPIKTNQQVKTYIDKLLKYEQNPMITDPSMLLCGQIIVNEAYQSYHPQTGYSDAHIKSDILIDQYIAPYWDGNTVRFYDTGTDFPGGANYDLNSENITYQLNQNYDFLHFAAHGSTKSWIVEGEGDEEELFTRSDVSNLTNTNPMIITTIACSTNCFDGAEPCLSEAFIRHPIGGAIAYLGCSRAGWEYYGFTSLGPSYQLNAKFFEILFSNVSNHFSEIVKLVKIYYKSDAFSNNLFRWIILGNNAIGDAELPIFTTTPNSFNDIVLEKNNTNLVVNTEDIDSCTITVSNIDYGGEYYYTYTNVSSAIFTNLPNVYTVIVTKDNYIPYIHKEGCIIANEIVSDYRSMENCEETQIGIICTESQNQTSNNTNVTPENSSTINSCGQVKITSNGSLDVHNGGVVKIKNLSMEDGSTLHIH